MKKSALIAFFIPLFLFSACAWFGTKDERTAYELAREGMDAYNAGRYRKSIEDFSNLRDWYPFSKYAMLAELKIGDANYRLEEYDEAIDAYREFENLHPRNEAVPYVIYQIGRCYYDRMDTIDRDQTSARNAVETFNRLIRQYPKNPYARRADDHVRECYNTMAGHDFYVGMYYFKKNNFPAALNRFKTVIVEYPDTGIHYKALRYISICEEKMKSG